MNLEQLRGDKSNIYRLSRHSLARHTHSYRGKKKDGVT